MGSDSFLIPQAPGCDDEDLPTEEFGDQVALATHNRHSAVVGSEPKRARVPGRIDVSLLSPYLRAGLPPAAPSG
jgi:hypothetical protein